MELMMQVLNCTAYHFWQSELRYGNGAELNLLYSVSRHWMSLRFSHLDSSYKFGCLTLSLSWLWFTFRIYILIWLYMGHICWKVVVSLVSMNTSFSLVDTCPLFLLLSTSQYSRVSWAAFVTKTSPWYSPLCHKFWDDKLHTLGFASWYL